MLNIISRHIINDSFQGVNLKLKNRRSILDSKNIRNFNKTLLTHKIDLWKYVLKYKCEAKKGESILIGMQVLDINYLAACFAALELSLKIVIVDYTRNDDFEDIEYFDPKTKILSPIDIFLHDFPKTVLDTKSKSFTKFKFFKECSNRTYSSLDLNFWILNHSQFEEAKSIFPEPTDIAMRCTSSGTTGTPKIVEHSHEFLYKITVRNANRFSGDCLHVRNLNHGSSLAVYLLPTLLSDTVTEHLFYDLDDYNNFDHFVNTISEYSESLENIIFPYPFMIDEFIDSSARNNLSWPKLNVQTLSYIQDKPKQAIKNNIFKSITSIFGSNETSGPVFLLTIDKDSLDRNSSFFSKVDDFYNIDISDSGLIKIGLPIYNVDIVTNDLFEHVGEYYVHKGRSDITKIDGEILDIKIINDLNLNYTDSYIVIDSLNNSLYLAFWEKEDHAVLDDLNLFFKNNFNKVNIKKISVLNKKRFLRGIKLDNELLREYFRNHV